MSIIPNFFIIGASKCGTTSIYNILIQQDGCCMSSIKEPFFFNDPSKEMEWYTSLFDECAGNIAIGEATPIYSETTYFPWIPEKIYHLNSSAKIVYIVRHPYDRLKSVWKQTLSTGHFYQKKYYHKKMPLRFEKAVFNYPPFLEACKYWTHIQNYRKFFDDSNIKIIYFEDYIQSTTKTMQELTAFLGLKCYKELALDSKQKNSSKGKSVSNPVVHFINKIPLSDFIKKSVPQALKERLKRKMRIPVPSNPHLSDSVKTDIRAILRDELRQLFEYTHKPADFWKL